MLPVALKDSRNESCKYLTWLRVQNILSVSTYIPLVKNILSGPRDDCTNEGHVLQDITAQSLI